MKKSMKNLIKSGIIVMIAVGCLWFLQRLLEPKYMSDVVEGAMIAEYYKENMDHDVVFIGDCELYENISPVALWEKYGINSYIRGSAQQLIWQSYYLLEDTLRYEKPDVVVFNVLAMKYDEPQSEAYNRMTIDGMEFSSSKIKSIQASMTEEENMMEYLFPILRYHSRITELTSEDFKYLFHRDKVTHNGYYMRVDVKAAGQIPEGAPLGDYRFGEKAYQYLDKMTAFCEENDIRLVLVKAPSLYPCWYPEWDEQMEDYAKEHNLQYYNFLETADEIGLDFSKDTYDGGLHLNLSGAEKLSDYFGKILIEECQVKNRRGDKKLEKDWEKKCALYYGERDAQYTQLEGME